MSPALPNTQINSASAWYGGVAMTVESATIVGYRPDYGCFDKLPL